MKKGKAVFSPNGKRKACIIQYGNGDQAVVIDGEAGKRYKGIGKDSLVFSLDGKSVAYLAKKHNEKWVVVLDGQESKEYPYFSSMPFFPMPDRNVVLFCFREKKNEEAVLDCFEPA